MSDQPEQKFYKNDIVIESITERGIKKGYMGVVMKATWDPFLLSHNYEYIRQYMTPKINGQVVPKR